MFGFVLGVVAALVCALYLSSARRRVLTAPVTQETESAPIEPPAQSQAELALSQLEALALRRRNDISGR